MNLPYGWPKKREHEEWCTDEVCDCGASDANLMLNECEQALEALTLPVDDAKAIYQEGVEAGLAVGKQMVEAQATKDPWIGANSFSDVEDNIKKQVEKESQAPSEGREIRVLLENYKKAALKQADVLDALSEVFHRKPAPTERQMDIKNIFEIMDKFPSHENPDGKIYYEINKAAFKEEYAKFSTPKAQFSGYMTETPKASE